MNLIQLLKNYIENMIGDAGAGMKCLLMDNDTTSIVSVLFSQTDVIRKEVYLFERIDRVCNIEPMRFIKCIVFIRPTKENINLLTREFNSPKFSQYFIYFNNIISNSFLMSLADADEYESVRDVQEIYADYLPVSPQLFSLNVKEGCYNGNKWNPISLSRCVDGITSLLLSTRKYPKIRYLGSSEMCKKLAEEVNNLLHKEDGLFSRAISNNSDSSSTVLLIADRKMDAYTPLLNQWTYQAMLHELLFINNNRINLSHVKDISPDMKEVVVSADQDEFYAKNMNKNFGEIGVNIKLLMEDFQDKSKNQRKVENIEDMKEFVETYPLFKKMSGTVSKHVTLISELSRLVQSHNLMDVSEAEQEMACQAEHSKSVKKVRQLLNDDRVRNEDKLRLVMLYALRFEKHSNRELSEFKRILKQKGVSDSQIKLINTLLSFVIPSVPSDLLASAEVFKKRLIQGLKGVENIYTQHEPSIKSVVEDCIKGRLRGWPWVEKPLTEKCDSVIIFLVGGITYEEGLSLVSFAGKVLAGGSFIHNSASFLEELKGAGTYNV